MFNKFNDESIKMITRNSLLPPVKDKNENYILNEKEIEILKNIPIDGHTYFIKNKIKI